MKQNVSLLLFAILLMACSKSPGISSTYKYAYLYQDLPFDMPRVEIPTFRKDSINLLDVGGNPDGITLNTRAFDKAMQELAERGGGTLVVPKGVWFTGPIVFVANIEMHLEKGALILFSPDKDLYPLVETIFEGLQTRRCQSPISGRNLENIAITGEGSINGSGEAWRPLKREKVSERHWKNVVTSGGVVQNEDYWFPSEGALKGYEMSDMNVPRVEMDEKEWLEIKDFLRPVMVSFIECKNLYLQGVLFENSPAWNIHPLMCENVIIDGIFARNPGYSQNGDGLDLESCKNAIIVNSLFDVGDDAICIKSGKDEEGRLRGRPTENVIVENCKVFQGHGGFVVGSEMSGGVKNISVTNCQFLGTDVGLRFKSNRGRGGIVENIYISNIYMFNIATDSFLFDLFYGGKSASEALADGDTTPMDEPRFPVTEETPVFRNIHVSDLVSRNARRAMFFNGLPEMNIENIHVENAFITARFGAEFSEAKDIVLNNVTVVPEDGPAYLFNNVKNFKADNLDFKVDGQTTVARITGKNTAEIELSGLPNQSVDIADDVDNKQVIFN